MKLYAFSCGGRMMFAIGNIKEDQIPCIEQLFSSFISQQHHTLCKSDFEIFLSKINQLKDVRLSHLIAEHVFRPEPTD